MTRAPSCPARGQSGQERHTVLTLARHLESNFTAHATENLSFPISVKNKLNMWYKWFSVYDFCNSSIISTYGYLDVNSHTHTCTHTCTVTHTYGYYH